MKWEQSSRDNNGDFFLLWRYSTQTMTRTRVNCSLVHLTTTEEELCLFSHLEAARLGACGNSSLHYVQYLIALHWKSPLPNISGSNEGRHLSTGTGKLQNAGQQGETNNFAKCSVVPGTPKNNLHMMYFQAVGRTLYHCQWSLSLSIFQ